MHGYQKATSTMRLRKPTCGYQYDNKTSKMKSMFDGYVKKREPLTYT